MSEHTKEPWESYIADWEGRECVVLGEKGLEGKSSRLVAIITETAAMNASDVANAHRIVACVNACAGISTSLLERATPFDTALFFKAQRDELLVVLKEISQADTIAHTTGKYSLAVESCAAAARAAIANAENNKEE